MNIYDNAHGLARAIKQSEEYKNFKRAVDSVKKDKSADKMLEDLRNKQMELQRHQLMGEKVDEKKVKKVQELYQIAMLNSTLAEYFQSEFKFMQIMEDVYKILGEAVDVGNNSKK